MRRGAAVAIAGAVIFGLTACNVGADPTKGMGDAGVDQHHIEITPATVIEFSDKYPNVEEKCDGNGFRIFTDTRSAGYLVVEPDPTCKSPAYTPRWRYTTAP